MNNRIAQFIGDLKALEKRHGLEIDHHGEYVSYLRDKTVSNNHSPIVATLFEDSVWEDEEWDVEEGG